MIIKIIITIIIFIYLTSKISNSVVNKKNSNKIRRKRILVRNIKCTQHLL